ncbi:U32 family peptidase [Alteribacter populi]|uniref:U32 family peptidase n=1 Tax=Alteribacter populi TaxID=2011011 RepID=UPI00315A4A41
MTTSGQSIALRHEGVDQLVYAMEDLKRGAELGLRGALVADEGLLLLTKEMKRHKILPDDFVVKVSVQVSAANPVSAKMLEDMGADIINVPTSLTLPKLVSIRQAIDIPMDIYIEVPDNYGGFLRYYEIPEIIRVLSPVYIKFGLKNHPDVYPSGKHLNDININLCKERVYLALIGMQMIHRYYPDAKMSNVGVDDLGVPLVQPKFNIK